MRKFKPVYLLLAAVTLFSCMKENMDGCDDVKANVYFPLIYDRDLEGENVIEDHIEYVDLIIFTEASSRPAYHIEFRLSDLDDDNTIKYNLPQGNYYAVAIGNLQTDRQHIYQRTATLTEGVAIEHTNTTSTDRLFYAPDLRNFNATITPADIPASYSFSVTEGTTVHPIEFMGAHHIVKVWLKGFPDIEKAGQEPPKMILNNFSSTYGYMLQQEGARMQFLQPAETAINPDGDLMGYRQFFIPHFSYDENITLNINGNDGSSDYTHAVTMQEIIDKLDLEIENGYNQTIEVLLTYGDLGLTITVPKWGGENVGPGLGK